MKRFISAILILAMLLTLLPAMTFAANAAVTTVVPGEGLFTFTKGVDWGVDTGWQSGKNDTEGLWLQSSSDDGASAGAAYVEEKLSGNWYVNAQLAPQSTTNSGRAVCRLQLLDQYKNPKVILTFERQMASNQICIKWQAIEHADYGDWLTLYQSAEWVNAEDTAVNVRLTRTSDTGVRLTLTGNKGYAQSADATISSDVMDVLCYAGFLTEKTTARLSNIQLGETAAATDYQALAKTTYDNLMRNFLDTANSRLYPVTYGYREGTVTNAGTRVGLYKVGAMWESVILLMAMDTYAQTLDKGSSAYTEVCRYIANTVKMFTDGYTDAEITQVNCIPINHAMDDCGWNAYGLLLGYRYHTALGNTGEAARCLSLAQQLFDNSYAFYYDSQLGGGMWYNAAKAGKSLYAATLALVGYDLWCISGSQTTYQRFLDIYNGIENNLRRNDGLYWIEITSTGNDSANPYDISEGGSCTYIGGNMCMAVLNARLGNEEKALQTAVGMARYETDSTGAYLNDRDAWNNTFFLGLFVREVMEAGITDELSEHVLAKTVRQIQKNCIFSDGYYSASWTGPKEPSSSGYPSVEGSASYWTGERNRWGTQRYENGMYIGSTPNQIMTSATTAHVLLAAVALENSSAGAKLTSLSVTGNTLWPVFNPDITSYQLLNAAGASVSVSFTASANASVRVNGQTASGSASVTTSVATLSVTSGDGTASRAYTVQLRSDCAHARTEVQNATAATCTQAGYSGDTVCLDCGETVLYGTTIPATGHTYVNGVCSLCGAAQTQEPVSPALFGWKTDEGADFNGWTTTDGLTLNGVYAQMTGNRRIWKNLLSDQSSFKVSLSIDADNQTSVYFKVLGNTVELDGRGGDGNQLYLKINGSGKDWITCDGCALALTLTRKSGGTMELEIAGGAATATLTAREAGENLELGLYAGTAVIGGISVTDPDGGTTPPDKTPADFGWKTDEGKSFDGWTTQDGVTITGSFANAVEDCRIWKELIDDETNFAAQLTYAAGADASGYVKILGNTIELDSRHGDGNQVFLKLNGADRDWITASACTLTLRFTRIDGGKLSVAIEGNDGDKVSLTLDVYETSKNMELGMYQGTVVFGGIAVTDPTPVQLTPADFGWKTDDGIAFDGWTTADGVTLDGVFAQTLGNHRIWKDLLTDTDSFKLQMTYTAQSETSGYVKLMGVIIELDSRGGEGDEVNLKLNGSEIGWLKAEGNIAALTVSRRDGGKLELTVEGKNGEKKTASAAVIETSSNVEIGLYAGSARFADFTVGKPDGGVTPPDKTPADFGWKTDEGKSFDGWTTQDGMTITGSFANAVEDCRIWKELIDDETNFAAQLTYAAGADASGYVKILGNTIELDSRHGDGNQVFLKLNGADRDWITASACTLTLRFTRIDGGKLSVAIEGNDGDKVSLTLDVYETSKNMELGMYQGTVVFGGIAVTDPTPVQLTPADFGWKTDDGIAFDGWTTADGVTLDGVFAQTLGNHRIWKDLLTDTDSFKLQMTYTAQSETSGYVKLMGVIIELDSRGGEGDEVNLKLNGSEIGWLKAEGNIAALTVSRRDGGKLELTVEGKNGEKKTASAAVIETSSNVEIGLYAGSARFAEITVGKPDGGTTPPPELPEVYGWKTDEDADLSGWSATDAANISGSYAQSTGNHRIFKQLVDDWNDFYITLDYTGSDSAAAYFKILGNTVELNGRGGNGNQLYIKINQQGKDWLDADGCKVSIRFQRGRTGNVTVTITGAGNPNAAVFSLMPADASMKFEIGLYAGDSSFTNIRAGEYLPAVFTDVPTGVWYYDTVYKAVELGLFKGTGETVFEPLSSMTRAMLVTVLYRMELEPEVTYSNSFTDVKPGRWYTEAVAWALNAGIVNGVGNNRFAPEETVTREQIVVMLYRYANYKQYSTSESTPLSSFADAASVSKWAKTAISWASACEILHGSAEQGKLYIFPLKNGNRAETATILVRFLDQISTES